ncbi:T9SS C-terminal target domain-containing protein [Flavobacterium album]|uniref:T9SS C-terminal target domain-containing protein n=1 Tax=Flavobacterium album TaxID=2175091 RepID=A0A2S1R159_9FLAO|nr:T9SS type A sorting domain-containing protein [Flavobacterium album]AWH86374.1 T9SS C-terminal target domain-containing protein [Flavobacterium album]
MNKPHSLYLLGIIFFCSACLNAQDLLWEKSYGGKHADYLLDAQSTADYGFILAGTSLSQKSGNKTEDSQGDLDYWIWKMDENGELDWQKNLGGTGADILYSIRNTNDGGFILGGTSDSQPGIHKKDSCRGKEDFWIVKLNAKGGEEWQRTIGGSGQEILKSIVPTKDGGYILGGSSASNISRKILKGAADPFDKSDKCRGNMDFWIVKLNEKGEVKWQRTLGGKYADMLESIEQTKDGGFIIGGYSNSPSSKDKSEEGYGAGDYWIIKLDKDGRTEWEKVFGGEEDDHLYTIKQTQDGGYILGGNSASATSGNKSRSNKKGTDIWLVRLDENAEILWQETYNTGNVDVLTSLIENNDGTFLLGGYAQTEVMGEKKADKKEINDYIAIKIAADGDELWKKAVGSNGEDILRKLIETRDGGYLLAGTSKGDVSRDRKSGQGSNDFWVVKLKDKDKKKKEEKRAQLEAIPNPTQQYTNVIVGFEYNTGTATVVDLSGHVLQTFAVTDRTIPVDLGSYADGLYIIEISTNAGTGSVKVMKGN